MYIVYNIMLLLYWTAKARYRKQSIKNKNNRSLSFHFDLFSGYWFVGLSAFLDFRLYLTNYSIKLIYILYKSSEFEKDKE